MESLDAEQELVIGEGPLPRELDCLNWNAFFWSGLWPLVYGIYPWFWGLFALRMASTYFFIRFNRLTPAPSAATVATVVAVWAVVNLGLAMVLAFKANALLWERRGWASCTAQPLTLSTYLAAQSRWVKFGIAIAVFSYGRGFLDGEISVSDYVGTAGACTVIAVAWALDRWRTARAAS